LQARQYTSAMLPDTGRDIDRARQHYDILRLAIEDLARAGDELAIAGIVKHAARQLTHADGVTVVLREDGAFCHYVDEDAIAPLWKGRRFPMETCISGWVMTHAQPAVIADISIDPRIPQDAYRPTFVRSLAMMPVGGSEALGAIGAYWAQPHIAGPEELADLQRLANSTALALQNLRLQAALESELRARAEAKRAVDLLAETVRLKDEFLATVAHELRQPIHAAVGALGVLKAGAPDTRAVRAREVLQRQLAHMARMIDDLLDASRIVRGSVSLQQERSDLRRVISLAVETAAPLVEHRGHRLVTTLPNDPVRLDVDSTRIQQVVTNLLSNAAKYTPEGGSIRVGLEVDGPHAVIRVQDNGYGIPGDAKDRIFEVFTRVGGERVRGFGIGLAVARKLVEQHRGTIAVHSDGPGQGSEFTVRLPLPSPAD
jgi:signal transduction histidine kinase